MCDYACQSDSNLVARFLSVTGQLITPRVNRGVGGCNSNWDEMISEGLFLRSFVNFHTAKLFRQEKFKTWY